MAAIPLEDSFSDIIGKALRGRKLSPESAAQQAGLGIDDVNSLTDGTFHEASARQLAPLLGLNADALVAAGEKSWRPAEITLEGLAAFNTPFEDMTVNSYLAWDASSGQAVAFDTGADATGMLELLGEKKLKLTAILLTHTHGDHVYDFDRLKSRTGAPGFVGDREPFDGAESFAAGRTFTCGKLQIESRLTWGHSKGGITYVVRGLARPVAIVGDAVFAGSMGGGGVSFDDALRTNRAEIFSLPDDTVVCPGHGPLTTIGEEKKHNPFYA